MKQLNSDQKQKMSALASPMASKSNKIRTLEKAGFSQGDISRFLGVRPQFVSNVIRADQRATEVKSQTAVDPMNTLIGNLVTKADKIRALDKAGYKRTDISNFLGIRYQQVRNVLVKNKLDSAHQSDCDQHKREEWVEVGHDGRIVIPVVFRRVLAVEHGGHILLSRDGDQLRLIARDAAMDEVQAIVGHTVAKSSSMADELIAERRVEASRD
jgi:bifunctional DNA-binding transcriptional regulator/antitoxin component of YhaV-PrlF toxin-antitoxin module